MKLWWNGTIIDETEAVIPITDHGFLYGIGLFETFRTYGGGRAFRLDRHVERLRAGCEELRIAYAPDAEAIREAVMETLRANGLEDGYVRWSVSAGSAPLGLPSAAGYAAPNVIIMAKSLPPENASPKELHLLKLPRSGPEGGAVRRKSFHYMNNILGKWELAARTSSSQAEGLFADGQGTLVEGIVSNVFWAKDGTLFTPSIDTGCLPGITRDVIIELARASGLSVVEGRFGWGRIAGADEAFVTNSVQEATPVGALFDSDGVERARWNAWPIAERLRQAYRGLTAGEGASGT